MFPGFNLSGVLPPYVGSSPTDKKGVSPYLTTMSEIAKQLCTSPERVVLFRGLVQYRAALAACGITKGIQWIDGSFCEDCEKLRSRPPGDIDVVTLLVLPPTLSQQSDWDACFAANLNVFDRVKAKETFHCDPSLIDIGRPAAHVFPQITYWFGLFTHQRVSFLWKGILAVPLQSDDVAAIAYLDGLKAAP